MGNQLASYPQTLQTDYYLHDLPGIVFEGNLGKGRFLKTLRCIHIEEGTIVVKVYIKRDQSQNLKDQTEKLTGFLFFYIKKFLNFFCFRNKRKY